MLVGDDVIHCDSGVKMINKLYRRNKYICVKQHDIQDCGAACIATISKVHGLRIPITKIREIAGTDKNGTNMYGLVKAAKALGFTAKGVRGDWEDIYSNIPLPAIAHVVIDNELLHYVVIHKITKGEIVIADPAKGIVKYKSDEFRNIWTGAMIILVPTTEFKTGDETKGLFRRFSGLLKPQKGLILNIFFASLLYTALGIFGAFYFKVLVDDILRYKLEKSLHVISIGVILLNVFKIVLNAFRGHLLLYLSQKN